MTPKEKAEELKYKHRAVNKVSSDDVIRKNARVTALEVINQMNMNIKYWSDVIKELDD